MNDYILINVKNNIKRFIDKCIKRNIELYDIKYINKKEIIVKINKKDLKNIKIYNYYSEINEYSKLGKEKILEKIYKQKYFIVFFILCLIIMYLISNIILKVNVIHSNKNIRELVYNELENNGIKKYSLKKDFNELETIKDNILNNNKDKLEWISITNIGMTYIVRIEERIIDEIKDSDEYCNIISNKDALITNIYSTKGEIKVGINDYVRKEDVLISGDILLNEEIKGNVCANGIVMGKVWYNTSITVERKYTKKEYTDKKRYNLIINNKILRKNKYNKYDKEYIFKNRFISLYKELEYKEVEYLYNEEELLNKALKEIDNKFKDKLNNIGKIIDKKILNKSINNDKITLDVFVITEENIGISQILNKNTSENQ
ncbi:MAG: sporulation protein YqfD [Bacilli bacterium]|nr:sporulation protein YqfD [Bacilli bacterium]